MCYVHVLLSCMDDHIIRMLLSLCCMCSQTQWRYQLGRCITALAVEEEVCNLDQMISNSRISLHRGSKLSKTSPFPSPLKLTRSPATKGRQARTGTECRRETGHHPKPHSTHRTYKSTGLNDNETENESAGSTIWIVQLYATKECCCKQWFRVSSEG